MSKKIILAKGESIMFLGYQIKNSLNNDGVVLSKPNGDLYETHLGNYGICDKDSIDNAKKAALVHYMIARPDGFSHSILHKIMSGSGSGTYHEWYNLRSSLLQERIYKTEDDFPLEIQQPGDGVNNLIYFNGKPLQWSK